MAAEEAIEDYLPRIADRLLRNKLLHAGAVEVRGPKWCGKTETSLQQAQSALFMQDPDELENNLALADAKPSLLLRGAKPRLIDEWQEAPQLWDAVRFAVYSEQEAGQYILTGSSTPAAKPRHSGTGRFSFLNMLPMSLAESKESTKEVSLTSLFAGDGDIQGQSAFDVESLAYTICRGGWPRAVTSVQDEGALEMAYDYVDAIVEEDISRADGVSRNAQYARVILGEYARCVSTQATQATMRRDLKARGTELSRETVDAYIATLRKLYVIQDLSAWEPSLRSRTRIAKTPTRHFADPSIAVAALGANPSSLLLDMSTYGLLFESLCIRDLRVYAQAIQGDVLHYHDESGLEADAVITLRDGRYALAEAKMSGRLVDEAAANLLKLASRVNSGVMGAPSFCAVLTPGGYAYKRSDGVCVIPIGCLTA